MRRLAARDGVPVLCGRTHTHRRVTLCRDLDLSYLLLTRFSCADKGHTCERSRNPNGALSGADASTAADAAHWSFADVERRMEFALRCAYAHGTQAVRTHLMSGSRAQFELSWCVCWVRTAQTCFAEVLRCAQARVFGAQRALAWSPGVTGRRACRAELFSVRALYE